MQPNCSPKPKKKQSFSRIATVAGNIVSAKGYVSVIDLLVELNWLALDRLADWKQGRVPYLEQVITASLGKISKAMKEFISWATYSKLKPSVTVYQHKNKFLRFSKTAHPTIELAYRTHYILVRQEITD